MRLWRKCQDGWSPCAICHKPHQTRDLSPRGICVKCFIREGEAMQWQLDASPPAGVVEWSENKEEVRELAMVTRPVEEGRRHVVTSLHASFNLAQIGLLTIRVGDGGLALKTYCFNSRDIYFGRLVIPVGKAVSASLMFRGDLKSLPEQAAATVFLVGYSEDVSG